MFPRGQSNTWKFLNNSKQYIMHDISRGKMSLEFAFTGEVQHSETDMQILTITSYILVIDCTCVNLCSLEDTMYINASSLKANIHVLIKYI